MAVIATHRAIARVQAKNLPLSPQKGRLVADLIRGLPVEQAMERLQFSRKKAGRLISKVLYSAIAAANEAEGSRDFDIDKLMVSRIYVLQGMSIQRTRFGARGRVNRITRRRSHIVLELDEKKRRK